MCNKASHYPSGSCVPYHSFSWTYCMCMSIYYMHSAFVQFIMIHIDTFLVDCGYHFLDLFICIVWYDYCTPLLSYLVFLFRLFVQLSVACKKDMLAHVQSYFYCKRICYTTIHCLKGIIKVYHEKNGTMVIVTYYLALVT